MIHEVWSDRATFKRLRFKPGLNIVLATRSELPAKEAENTKRTRNGAGKSSLVDIIRFLTGGEIGRNSSVLDAPILREDTFFMKVDVGGVPITALRSPATKGRTEIQGDFSTWPVRPDVNAKTGQVSMTNRNWNDVLGQVWFGLPPESRIAPRSNLSHSACISFFVRRSRDGGFSHWVLTHRSQSAVRQASPLFHLLGLDPEVALKFVRLDDSKKAAAELKRAIDKGLLSKTVGTPGHLRNELVKARRRGERLENRIAGADIIEFYGEYEREAAQLDRQISDINDANYMDEQLLQDLSRATEEETIPALPDIRRLYEEARVVLPDISLKQYEEVHVFHRAVVANRKAHLESEIGSAHGRIAIRNKERERLARRHSEILGLLQSGVSILNYRKLDNELIQTQAEIADLSHRLALAEKFENLKMDVKAEKVDAERSLRDELRERRVVIETAISTFQEISGAIYETPAEFDVAPSATGPKFAIREPAILSDGISNMQIFTFDFMLSALSAKRGFWPGFLVHDSHIFDGVDGRQVGAALAFGPKKATELGGQYIVTMNSDDLEKAEKETGMKFSDFVLDPVLTDTPSGGLFGISFEHDNSSALLVEED